MIRQVKLRRFKRFADETFDLSGHVILAGPNNCGKTTVLQSVATWSMALKRWKELNDYQRHGGAYAKAPIARPTFSAVPMRSFDLLWNERLYQGSIEIGVLLASGENIVMEISADSTEQVYVRPHRTVAPGALTDFDLDVVYLGTVGGRARAS